MNKLHVYSNNKLYENQLKKSLESKKLDEAKYILEKTPDIKTLDYYKYLVKYYFMIDKLDQLTKVTNKENDLFIKN